MAEETGKITVVIRDPQWNDVGEFVAGNDQSIADMAVANGVMIPLSCGAGVCGVCLCKVIEWWEIIKADAFNTPLIPLQNDANWNPAEVLTCVAWFKPEAFSDWIDHKVILQRTY